VREFLITNEGVRLRDPYVGPEGVLTGSARLAQEVREREKAQARQQEAAQRAAEFARRRRQLEAQMAELQLQLAEQEREFARVSTEASEHDVRLADDRVEMARSRNAAEDLAAGPGASDAAPEEISPERRASPR
jgi:circadian clock protein KaiC